MAPVDRVAFIENYIEPVIHHRVCQIAFRVVAEIVKIVAAKMFLEFTCRRFLSENSKYSSQKILLTVVTIPILEEIIFGGFILRPIYMMQKDAVSEEEKLNQRVFRVHLSALIFAAAHLSNPHENVKSALIQFTWAYAAGVTFGYVSEKYQTLSVSILVHGIHNGIYVAVTSGLYSEKYNPVFIVLLIINQIAIYTLAKTDIDVYILSGVRQAVVFGVAIPQRAMNYFVPLKVNEPILV